MPLVDFGRTGEGAESGDLLVAEPAGHDRRQAVSDEAGVVLVAFDDLAADQFAGDDLEQARARAGVRLGKEVPQHPLGGRNFAELPKPREHAAGLGQLVIAEVVDGELLVVQQPADFVIEPFGPEGLDQGREGLAVHGGSFKWTVDGGQWAVKEDDGEPIRIGGRSRVGASGSKSVHCPLPTVHSSPNGGVDVGAGGVEGRGERDAEHG